MSFSRLRWLWPLLFFVLVLSACRGEAVSTPLRTAAVEAVTPPAAVASAAPRVTLTGVTEAPASPTVSSPTATIFRLPSATPTVTRPAAAAIPSPTPDCMPGLTFVEDLTIPDGAVVSPGAAVDKRWRVTNSGACNWDERYRLRLISGPGLGRADEQALYPARAGQQVEIRMLLTAPSEPGTYRSAWQAFDPAGVAFGDPIFVEITIPSSAPPTPTP